MNNYYKINFKSINNITKIKLLNDIIEIDNNYIKFKGNKINRLKRVECYRLYNDNKWLSKIRDKIYLADTLKQIQSFRNKIEHEEFKASIPKSIISEIQDKFRVTYKKTENDIKNIDLNKLYVKYNKKYFNNELPAINKVKITWSKRLTSCAGKCTKSRKWIRLSVPYHRKFPEEIKATLIHEMIHLKILGHGVKFKRELNKINSITNINVTRYSSECAKINYVWYCKNHGVIGTQSKKSRSFNQICSLCKGKIALIKI